MNFNQTSSPGALALAMATGAALGRITPSSLMSPEETEAVMRRRPDLQGKLQGWCLCLEVPNAVWDRARDAHARNEPSQMLVVTGSSGCKYLVVVLHSKGWQHRVCIPLVGNTTSRWLDALASTKVMQMSVARADSAMSFISESQVPSGSIAQLEAVDTSMPDDLPGFLEEAFRLVAWNAVVAATEPRGQRPVPDDLSLSLLLPAEVEAQLEQGAPEWRMRKLS